MSAIQQLTTYNVYILKDFAPNTWAASDMIRYDTVEQSSERHDDEVVMNPPPTRGHRSLQTPQSSSNLTLGPFTGWPGQDPNVHALHTTEAGAIIPRLNQTLAANKFLSTAALLGNFRPPEVQPVFKVEPTEPNIMKLPLRTSRTPKNEKPSIYAVKPRKRPAVTTSKEFTRNARRGLDQSPGPAQNSHDAHQHNAVVDLTVDDNDEEEEEEEERTPSPHRDNNVTAQRLDEVPHIGPFAPSDDVFNDQIPDMALQHIRRQCQQDRIKLPTNITKWQQLLEFASANTKPSHVTPALVSRYRATSWSHQLPHPKTGPFAQQPAASVQNTIEGPTNRNLFYNQNISSTPSHQASSSVGDRYHADENIGRAPGITNHHGTDFASLSNTRTKGSTLRPSDHGTVVPPRLRPQNMNSTQGVSNVITSHEPADALSYSPQTASTVEIDDFTKPSDALSHLLPPFAPFGHPHLVPLWHPYLLRLPKAQHSHLDLIDTVVSIMCRYDMREQSVIKAFLDMNEVQHFFFLFKSRTNAWHSWSVEREYNIVTVGLERNNRAANTTESQRPSSGQFDVTIQFKMDPPMSTGTTSNKTSTMDTADGTSPMAMTPQSQSHVHDDPKTSSTTENDQASILSPPPSEPTAIVPGLWHLHGTTFFPSQPSLPEFLWTTPPNRGADEISRYHHPAQSHILPSSQLSILARYLQHTAFTCTAIEAEFQVVWGRKVRYDSILGRVRATYDHALKGAKTQAEKRKRGEYNRPVGKSGLSAVTNVNSTDDSDKEERTARPGAGDTMEFLSGKNVNSSEGESRAILDAVGMDMANIAADTVAARGGNAHASGSAAGSALPLSDRMRRALSRSTTTPTNTATTATSTASLIAETLNAPHRTTLDESAALSYHPTTIKAERPRKRLKRERPREASGSEYSDSGSEE